MDIPEFKDRVLVPSNVTKNDFAEWMLMHENPKWLQQRLMKIYAELLLLSKLVTFAKSLQRGLCVFWDSGCNLLRQNRQLWKIFFN